MLTTHLNKAIIELEFLIDFTKEDISLVREANHDKLSQRHTLKEQAVARFEQTKSELNSELLRLSSEGSGELSEVLDEEQHELLDEFKNRLVTLKELNRDFSAIVIVVNEFYQSLFSRMFQYDMDGYNQTKPISAAMLKVSA